MNGKVALTALVLAMTISGSVSAAYWLGTVSNAWSEPGNWSLSTEPSCDPPIGARIHSMLNEPVITEAGECLGTRSYVEMDATVTMLSGDLVCLSRLYLGSREHGQGSGTLTMRGGLIDIPTGTDDPGRLSVGDEEAGILNMHDGEIRVTWPTVDNPDGGAGIQWPDGSAPGLINMYGGEIWASQFSWKFGDDRIMTFFETAEYPHGGKVYVHGDATGPINQGAATQQSMALALHMGMLLTAVPGDVVNIHYDDVNDWTVIESVHAENLPTPCGINGDDIVDSKDLKTFMDNWLWVGLYEDRFLTDFNGDGRANFVDYAVLASQLGDSCP
jgi:hypothetical protein